MGNTGRGQNGRDVMPERLAEAQRRVNAGRRLVIYERTTGLFAQWYIALRCEEECYRAQRYDRPLSIAVLEPDRREDAWDAAERTAATLLDRMRKADLPGYFGNARFVLVMPETARQGAQEVLGRVCKDVPGMVGGVAAFPSDGLTFDQLYEVAVRRIDPANGHETAAEPTPFRRVKRPDWPATVPHGGAFKT